MTICRVMFVTWLGLRLCLESAAATPPAVATNSPSAIQPDPTTALLKQFQIKKGFRIELVASEPLVVDPIAMAFDENGRLFVVESHQGPNQSAAQTGRVRVLEDTDGDGVFDTSSVYADNLTQPAAVACYAGGVFVACGSEIIFFKDTKGDGVADVRRVACTTYGDVNRGTYPAVCTCLEWGLDNRIHVGRPTGGGSASSSAPARPAVTLSEGNFAFDPRTFLLQAESGVAPSGLCFDDRGRKFVCSSGDHIVLVMEEARYGARNPTLTMPGALLDIGAGGAATAIFPLRADAGTGTPARFTSATGLTIYRGDAFPSDYVGDAFVADSAAGIIHHEKLRASGLELIAERPADESGVEFLAARDGSFQPMQIINAPDGALYLADQAGGAVDLPIPIVGKTNMVARLPTGHGRIYRIVPAGFKQPKGPQLARAKTTELAALLKRGNGWHRDTAARLLYERQDKSALSPLIGLLMDPLSPPLARVHALHALDGMHALVEPHLFKGLMDADDRVREHSVQLAERFASTNGVASDPLWKLLSSLAADPAIQVRHQLAFTLGQFHAPGRVRALADILRPDAGNRWIQSAVLSSLTTGAGEMFSLLATDPAIRDAPGGNDLLDQLLLMAGAANQPEELTPIFNSLVALPDSARTFRLARVLADGLQRADSSLRAVDASHILQPMYSRAARVASDYNAPEAIRVEAILLYGTASFAECGHALLGMLNAASTQPIQFAAIATLEQFADPAIAPGLVQRWGLLTPGARAEAIVALLGRPDRTAVLLTAMENGSIGRAELGSPQVRFLLAHPDAAIRQRARNLFGNGDDSQRQGVVSQLLPASHLSGNGARGQNIFATRCAACHQLGGGGSAAGVDLSFAARGSREALLEKILEPNRNIDLNHPFCLIETSEGETLTGFISSQTTGLITLCQASGSTRQVSRSHIRSLQGLNGSAMPEGLEAGLNQQGLADLLEYIASASPVAWQSGR